MTTTGSAPLPDAATVQEWIHGGGFHRWLGLPVTEVGPDSIELTATWREEWTNDSGADVTHGGIIGSLLDLAADWALVGSLGTAVPTIDFTTHYLRAAGRGDLRVVGRAIKPGRTVSFAEAEVYGPDGKLVATGRGSYASGVAAQIVAAREAASTAATTATEPDDATTATEPDDATTATEPDDATTAAATTAPADATAEGALPRG